MVINNTPSNIFQKMLLVEKYIQNCQASFGLFECEWFNETRSSHAVSSGMNGRLVHELEYHYSGGAFGNGPDTNITIRYYRKMDQLAKYKLANNSNFTVYASLYEKKTYAA